MRSTHQRRNPFGAPLLFGALLFTVGIAVVQTNTAPATLALSDGTADGNSVRIGDLDYSLNSEAIPIGEPAGPAANAVPAEPDAPAVPALPDSGVTPQSSADDIRAMQVRLTWTGLSGLATDGTWDAGTTEAVKHFQWKHLYKKTGVLSAQNAATLSEVARDGKLDPRCFTKPIVICVDKTQKVTRYVKNGQVLRVMDSNYGPEKGNEHYGEWSSTREGVFKIFYKKKDAFGTLYGYPMPDFMAFDGGEGFHRSDYFAEVGYRDVSQGCIVTGDAVDSEWLYDNTPMHTRVVVYH